LSLRAFCVAVLALSAAFCGAGRAASLDEAWTGTGWGESPQDVQRHFGALGFALPQPIDFGDSYAPLVVRNVSVGGISLIAYYQFDKATHGLKRVQQLERPRHMVNPDVIRSVFLALDAEYGAPDTQCGTLPGPTTANEGAAEYVWKRDDAVIRAIFRDTSRQVLYGCYSPACGLTAQLLLRISRPAEDKGTCPPPPTSAQFHAPR
jgi:hypothetical protein